MALPVYSFNTEAVVASAAATTAKTILGVKAHANSGVQVKGYWIAFDGVTASEKPILVEIGYCTWATQSPGTASTSVTVRQMSGRVLTAGFTAARNWTTEPTTITVSEEISWDPNKGVLKYDYPLGDEPDSALAEGFVIRCTVPTGGAAVNYRSGMKVTRI